MNPSRIKSLADQGRYEEAFSACEELLTNSLANKAEVLRARAYVFVMQDDFESAIKDRESIIDNGDGLLKDYYLVAEHALYANQFDKAVAWFNDVLRIGEEQGEDWFKGATHFLLAYAQMELGKFDAALGNLDCAVAIESDIAMPTPIARLCDNETLRREIKRRKEGK